MLQGHHLLCSADKCCPIQTLAESLFSLFIETANSWSWSAGVSSRCFGARPAQGSSQERPQVNARDGTARPWMQDKSPASLGRFSSTSGSGTSIPYRKTSGVAPTSNCSRKPCVTCCLRQIPVVHSFMQTSRLQLKPVGRNWGGTRSLTPRPSRLTYAGQQKTEIEQQQNFPFAQ